MPTEIPIKRTPDGKSGGRGTSSWTDAETLCQSPKHVNSLGFYVASIDNAVGLSGNEFRVLVHLRHRQGKNAYAWPCIRTIAERCEMHPTTAQKVMNRLQELGAITILRGTKASKESPGRTSRYIVHSPEKWAQERAKNPHAEPQSANKERAKNPHAKRAKKPHIIRTYESTHKEEEKSCCSLVANGQQDQTAFLNESKTMKDVTREHIEPYHSIDFRLRPSGRFSPEETQRRLREGGAITEEIAAKLRAESAQTRLEPEPEPIDFESLEIPF